MKSAICDLPKDSGPCEGLFPKYYYDSETNKCNKFYYGGCKVCIYIPMQLYVFLIIFNKY